jgi:hypothetical protein
MKVLSTMTPHLVRYGFAAVVVGTTYLGLTLLLSGPAGAPIQVVLPFTLLIAVALHFTLQRWFVFGDRGAFALTAIQQARRYAVLVPLQYAATAASTAVVPHVLGTTEQVAYVGTVLVISGATFLFLRARVFHAEVSA